MQIATKILQADPAGIEEAAAILRSGGLVAFPTETVYGLGGDARNGRAVARIFDAKGRPTFNPLIVHVLSVDEARKLVEWPEEADRLASAFWPGPLTLVLPLRGGHGLSELVTAGLPTLAIRIPSHPAARMLLAAFGGPVAAPSANRSGRISPTSAAHVQSGLSGRIEAILDDGRCEVGLESTIVGLAGTDPVLLRPGGVPAEQIEKALSRPLETNVAEGQVSAPGQLASHYAPRAKLRLNAKLRQNNEHLLGFGKIECDLNLSPSGDMLEAASNLFEYLYRLDAQGVENIAVSPIPERGIGRAINDRLRRAAAPRPD